MLDGVLNLIPSAKVSVLGLERNEETLEVRTYYKKLVPDVANRLAMIIDPMLATGNSLVAAIDVLKASGCKDIRVMVLVAAPEGVAKVEAAHPDVQIYTASIDNGLNEQGYIVPGLGDAGDKILVVYKRLIFEIALKETSFNRIILKRNRESLFIYCNDWIGKVGERS